MTRGSIIESMATESPLLGYLALNACTVLWGTQHAVMKSVVVTSKLPTLVNAIRFSTAAIVTASLRILFDRTCGTRQADAKIKPGKCGLFMGAAELALWQTLGFTFQIIGLNWTTVRACTSIYLINAIVHAIIHAMTHAIMRSSVYSRTHGRRLARPSCCI